MQEKREYVRSNGLAVVDFKGPEIEGKSSALDVSGTGIHITTDKQLKAGTELELGIFLPGDPQVILAKGKVVWVRKYKQTEANPLQEAKEYFHAGVKFTTINEKNREKIINYVFHKLH